MQLSMDLHNERLILFLLVSIKITKLAIRFMTFIGFYQEGFGIKWRGGETDKNIFLYTDILRTRSPI